MTHQIVYRHRMEYDTKVAGVVLPVMILAGDRAEAINAAVDTGSTLCVFQYEIAERLGIRVEDGIEDYVSAMGTIIKVYGHEVTLVVEELSMDLIVYFPAYQQIPRNLLGRQGFLQRMLFGLDDYEGVVYFGYHSDQ
ncbi:MAG: hypothetical protein MOB07_25405 [Acidobacteria bacterium]|nr:hypothetical protein [Acidobacteriota bacterium]